MTVNWTQPCCLACYAKRYDGTPVNLLSASTEKCCFCGQPTSDGIYVRADPFEVAFPTESVPGASER